jgi:protein phosphatase
MIHPLPLNLVAGRASASPGGILAGSRYAVSMSYRSPSPLTCLRVAARTDAGRSRTYNEDTFLVADMATGARHGPDAVDATFENAQGVALAVVDGMGGYHGGVEAARMIADTLAAALTVAPPSGEEACRRRLAAAMSGASRVVFEAAHRDRRLLGTSGCAVLAVVQGDRLHLASAGDSRIYLLRAGRLVQVTRDDSLINEWYAHVDESKANGGSVPDLADIPAHVITKALGLTEGVEVAPATFALRAGDVILLQSDGLSSLVDDGAIEQVLRELQDPAEACLALVNLALRNGGDDNITVVVARPDEASLLRPGPGDALESRNVPRPPSP